MNGGLHKDGALEWSKLTQARGEEAGRTGADPTRVLVIDDEPATTRLISRSLEGIGSAQVLYGVPEAGALDLDGVELVILDYRMPIRDGLEVLEEIREMDSELPVIFLTGFGDPELAEKALAAGANLFLTKPVEPSVIREAAEELVARKNRKPHADRGYLNTTPAPVTSEFGGEGELGQSDRVRGRFFARAGAAEELAGTVDRFGYRSVFVELPRSSWVERGFELGSIHFDFGSQELQCGPGVVGEVVPFSSDTVVAEVFLEGSWGVDLIPDGEKGRGRCGGRTPIEETLESERAELPAEFRLAVFELMDTLDAVRQATAQIGSAAEEPQSPDHVRFEAEAVDEVITKFGPVFWKAVQRFESVASEIREAELETEGRAFVRRVLFPFTLSSPFLARVVERPIGVPGDYGMLGMILGNPYEGFTNYDRVVNAWILSCGAAAAYRHRVDLLYREIVGAVERAEKRGEPARILSMASGVAYEVQRFVAEGDPGPFGVDFSLVDFSEETLEEAKRQYQALGAFPEGVEITFHRSSVIDLANQSRGFAVESGSTGGFAPREDYDLVYCAGLFDYLSDRLIRKVAKYLGSVLRPGGKLVLSNFTTANPICSWMTYVMDWELIYRSREAFTELMREALAEETEIAIESDDDGVEVYAIASKR